MGAVTTKLSQAQIDFFHREGYLALHALTDAAEVTALQGVYDRLFATKAGRAEGNHLDLVTTDEDDQEPVLPQILNPATYAPELAETRFRTNALAIARQLLGEYVVAGGDHAILKPPHTLAATPWHQDEAYWDADKEYESISIWIPLQPATLDNGCMQFIPGSHHQTVLPHHPIGNDVRVIGLEVDGVDQLAIDAVACPLPAGGATIHHARTLHYTGPNQTDRPRRAYIMSFGIPPKSRAVARDFYWQRMQKTQWQERATAAQDAKSKTM